MTTDPAPITGASLAERLINRPRRTATYKVFLDPNRQSEAVEAQQELRIAQLVAERDDAGPEALDRHDKAKARWDDLVASTEVATFTLQSIGRARMDEIITDYPPTTRQTRMAKQLGQGVPQFDNDEVVPRVLAEAIQSVRIEGGDADGIVDSLSVEQVREMHRSKAWPTDDIETLAGIARDLCTAATKADALGKG